MLLLKCYIFKERAPTFCSCVFVCFFIVLLTHDCGKLIFSVPENSLTVIVLNPPAFEQHGSVCTS